jgi:hypothetical protein
MDTKAVDDPHSESNLNDVSYLDEENNDDEESYNEVQEVSFPHQATVSFSKKQENSPSNQVNGEKVKPSYNSSRVGSITSVVASNILQPLLVGDEQPSSPYATGRLTRTKTMGTLKRTPIVENAIEKMKKHSKKLKPS